MYNFYTNKEKEKLLKNKEYLPDIYNNFSAEQKQNVEQNIKNTASQNFTASDYNLKARQNWEENWQTAYRRDILWINDDLENKNINNNQNISQNQVSNSQAQNTANSGEVFWQNMIKPTQVDENSFKTQNNIENNDLEKNATKNELEKADFNQNNQNIDWQNWNVDSWKKRWSSKDELENAIEKKYNTVASWWEDGSLEAVINWQKFKWTIDSEWNPKKVNLWAANSLDIAKNQVSQMIQIWSSFEDINNYIYKNNLQNDPIIKKQLSQKLIDDWRKPIIKKYSSLSLEDLHKAVENGEIIPGSPIFEELPQAQAYNQVKDSLIVINSKKDKDFSTYNAALDIEKVVSDITSKFFDTSAIKEISEKFKNDEELKGYRNDIYLNQKKIASYQEQIKSIWDRVRQSMGWASESIIQSEIARRTQDLMGAITTETNLMNASASMISMKKDDFQTELSFLKYEDSQKKDQYEKASDIYYKERARMDLKEQREFEEKSKKFAFERNKEWEMQKMKWSEENKWWSYETDINWNLLYVKNGVATKVKDSETWEIIWMTRNQNYSDNIYKNNYWGYDVLRTYKDGRVPDRFSVWADWKMQAWTSFWIIDLISNIPEKWRWPHGGLRCWEWVNKYLANAWIKDIRIKDSWASKKALIDSKNPVIWWLVTFSVPWKWAENWHIWIVTWINGSKVQITDWNAKWDWKKNTYEMEIYSVLNRDWWFINNRISKYAEKNEIWEGQKYWNIWDNFQVSNYDHKNISLYEKYNKWKMTKEDWNQVWENWEIFKQKAYLYGEEKRKQTEENKATPLLELYDLMKDVKNKPNFSWVPGTNDAFKRKLEYIRNNFTFEKLQELKAWGATFGSLSDSELKTIANAASMLKNPSFSTYDSDWTSYVENVMKKVENSLSKMWVDTRPVTKLSKDEIEKKYSNNANNKKLTQEEIKKAAKKYY